MAKKSDELVNPASCFNKTPLNEPIFILRAQDEFASHLVREWAYIAKVCGVNREKVEEATQLADLMDAWPARKRPN